MANFLEAAERLKEFCEWVDTQRGRTFRRDGDIGTVWTPFTEVACRLPMVRSAIDVLKSAAPAVQRDVLAFVQREKAEAQKAMARWPTDDLEMRRPYFARLQAFAEVEQFLLCEGVCNKCGWDAPEGWKSTRCGASPFGSCDGLIRSRSEHQPAPIRRCHRCGAAIPAKLGHTVTTCSLECALWGFKE